MYNCKQFVNFDVFSEQDADMINPIASLSPDYRYAQSVEALRPIFQSTD